MTSSTASSGTVRAVRATRAARATRRMVVVGALVVGLTGCSGSAAPESTGAAAPPDPTTAAPSSDPTDDRSTPTEPTAAPTPSPAPAPSDDPTTAPAPSDDSTTAPAPSDPPDGDLEAALPECDDERRDELETLVGAQLEAFAAEDFAGARELASTTFRAGIDVDDFEALIREQYPVVLADTDPAFGRCASIASNGVLEVALSGPDGVASLVWLLIRENGRWAIDGAQYTTPPADDDTIET